MKMKMKMIPYSAFRSRRNSCILHTVKFFRCLYTSTDFEQRVLPSIQINVVNEEKPAKAHPSFHSIGREFNTIRGVFSNKFVKESILFYQNRDEKGKSFSTVAIPNSINNFDEEKVEDSRSSSLLNKQIPPRVDEKNSDINEIHDFVVVDKDELVEVKEDSDNEIIDICTEAVVVDEGDLVGEDGRDENAEFYDYIQSEDNIDELLSVLLGLEEYFPDEDPRICCTCLRLAELCYHKGENPEKILDYARKGYHNFNASKEPIKSTKCLLMMGIGHHRMGELKEAMLPLGKAAMMLENIEVPLDKEQEIATLQYSIHVILGQVKISLGWLHEAILEFKKGLNSIDRVLSPHDLRLGTYYMQVAEAYIQTKNHEEALSLCLKAFPIYTSVYGSISSEVVDLRSVMLQIHNELNDYENVVSECEEVVSILKDLGRDEEVLGLTLESMQAFFHLARFKEAMVKLKDIIGKTKNENSLHVEALILLARAYAGLKDEKTCADCCMKAFNILEGNKQSVESAKSLVRLSIVYEQLQNYDQAMLVIHKALEILGQFADDEETSSVSADVEGHLGYLYLCIGKPDEALPYLERSIARKKDIHDQESLGMVNVWNHLGVAYAHGRKLEEALYAFKSAQLIITKDCRSFDLLSIYIHNNLSLTCKMIGRIDEAIKYKQTLIELMKKSKNTSFDLNEAQEELEALLSTHTTKNGKVDETTEQVLGKMLRTCTGTWITK